MYKPKPSHPCDMPAPGTVLKALVLNGSLAYYAQLLKQHPLVPKTAAA